MAKRINVGGAQAKRVGVVDQPRRRIEPAELAASLGAQPGGEHIGAHLDPISLAELGTELQRRLRSSGGRPALADATEFCRVPLSKEDVNALERITALVERCMGTKPSPGQVASIIVRDYLTRESDKPHQPPLVHATEPPWPEGWNGKRECYKSAQELIESAKTTWGRKGAA